MDLRKTGYACLSADEETDLPGSGAGGGRIAAIGGDLSIPRLLLAYRSGHLPLVRGGRSLVVVVATGAGRTEAGSFASVGQDSPLPQAPSFRGPLRFGFRGGHSRCSQVPRPGQDGTWITPEMHDAYVALHRAGHAHSVEAWRDGELRGGLYGVSIGGAFFGESMFSLEPNASRAALAALDARLAAWGFTMLDGQLPHEGLVAYGFNTVPRVLFLAELAAALGTGSRVGSWAER